MFEAQGGYSALHLLVAILVGIVIGRLSARRPGPPRPETAHAEGRLDAETKLRIEQLLVEDRTIEAIRDVRLATGLGLKDAKDLVDSLRASRPSGGARPPIA